MRLLFYFLFSIVFLSKVSAQQYIPMLGQHSEWRVVSCFGGCVASSYTCTGDTLIDGKHYQTLGGYHYIQGNFLIREDAQERKVYMKLLGGHVLLDEYPLYDFSLTDGDSVHVYNPISPLPEDGGIFVLDSIVNRPLETESHRFFYLHAVDPVASGSERTVWVEGVGALSLINSPGAAPNEGDHLGCSYVDGVHKYARLDSIGTCEVFNNINVPKPKQLTIFPTVFNDQVRIIGGEEIYNSQLNVYTITGSLVYSTVIPSSSNLTISSQLLPKGILLFVLSNDSGNVYRAKGINIGQ